MEEGSEAPRSQGISRRLRRGSSDCCHASPGSKGLRGGAYRHLGGSYCATGPCPRCTISLLGSRYWKGVDCSQSGANVGRGCGGGCRSIVLSERCSFSKAGGWIST